MDIDRVTIDVTNSRLDFSFRCDYVFYKFFFLLCCVESVDIAVFRCKSSCRIIMSRVYVRRWAFPEEFMI